MLKHTLFIGLNDQLTKQQEIDSVTAFKIVLNAVKMYYDGGTIREARGFYKHESGEITIENTLEVEILFADYNKTKNLITDLKTLLNQESIGLEINDIKTELL